MTRLDSPMSKKAQFLHILALVGGWSQDGPFSPLRNSEFWDPCKPVATGMALGKHGPGATGFIFRTPGARVDVPGARTNIGVPSQHHNIPVKDHPHKTCSHDELWLVAVADGGCGYGWSLW